jgi:hypothetical protein
MPLIVSKKAVKFIHDDFVSRLKAGATPLIWEILYGNLFLTDLYPIEEYSDKFGYFIENPNSIDELTMEAQNYTVFNNSEKAWNEDLDEFLHGRFPDACNYENNPEVAPEDDNEIENEPNYGYEFRSSND